MITLMLVRELTPGTITPYGVVLEVHPEPTTGYYVRVVLPDTVKALPAAFPVITLGTVDDDLLGALREQHH